MAEYARRGTGAARRRRARDLAPARRKAIACSSTRARRSAREFATRFPIIAAACRAAGDRSGARADPGPPAEHYHMGGVAVDAQGRSSVDGSLGLRRSRLHRTARRQSAGEQFADRGRRVRRDRRRGRSRARRRARRAPLRAFAAPPAPDPAAVRADPVARRRGDARAATPCAPRSGRWPRSRVRPGRRPIRPLVALMIVVSALRREASVGAHCRLDFPERPARAPPIATHARRGARRGRRDRAATLCAKRA